MNGDRGAVIFGAVRFAPHLFIATHIAIGTACMLISGVLLFDRAAATRAMFDNRVAFGAFILLCGSNYFGSVLTFYKVVHGMEAVIMLATCVISITVAWLTLRALLVKRAAPA